MIIRRIKLTNWMNFQHADVELQDRNFIVGANASGKSNFLDVVRFMRDVAKPAGGLQYAVEQRGGIKKIRCLAARKVSNIEIEIHLAEALETKAKWIYSLSMQNSGGGIFTSHPTIISEKVFSVERDTWILSRTKNDKKEDDETLRFTYLEQPNSNSEFREVYYFFQNIQYLHIIPQLIRDASSYVLASNKEDFYGRNLLDRIAATPGNTRNAYLRRINEVLQLAVPQLKNIDFVKDEKGIPHLEAIYEHWRAKGAKQQESQFSDGTLRLIGFMWALLDGQETILLEEPELYLHSAIIKQLPEFIFKFQRRKGRVRQVIISTHSYDLLSSEGISGDETIVLVPTREGTEIKKAKDITDIKRYLDRGFTVAEAVIPAVAPKKISQLSLFAD